MLLGKLEGSRDVGRVGALRDQCRMPVKGSIENQARRMVVWPARDITRPASVAANLPMLAASTRTLASPCCAPGGGIAAGTATPGGVLNVAIAPAACATNRLRVSPAIANRNSLASTHDSRERGPGAAGRSGAPAIGRRAAPRCCSWGWKKGSGARIDELRQRAVPALGLDLLDLDAAQLQHVLVLRQRRVLDPQGLGLRGGHLQVRIGLAVGLGACTRVRLGLGDRDLLLLLGLDGLAACSRRPGAAAPASPSR